MINVNRVIKDSDYLFGKNGTWRSYWQDVARFALPTHSFISAEKFVGQPLDLTELYDETAQVCNLKMGGAIDYNLSNSATKWFNIQTERVEDLNDKPSEIWFNLFNDYVRYVLNNSNFDNCKQQYYPHKGCFGTAVIFTQEDDNDIVSFKLIPIEQVSLVEDAREEILAVYRQYKMTAMQAFEEFGSVVGPSILEVYQDRPYEEFEFIHYVGKRANRQTQFKDRMNMEFEGAFISKKDMHLIKETGYEEMPYSVGRFYKHPNDPFAFSPAMIAKAKTLLINKQEQTALLRAMKEATPPTEQPLDGYISPLDFNPHGQNFFDPMHVSPENRLRTIPFNSNFSITLEMMNRTRDAIREAFFIPQLEVLTNITKQMTIPEVQQRIMEGMALLGPAVGRDMRETWKPTLERVARIIIRQNAPYWMIGQAGTLPPPPPSLAGKKWAVDFVSPLAKAQKTGEMNDLINFFAIAKDVIAVQIEGAQAPAMDMLNVDEAIKEARRIKGVNPSLVNSDEVIAANRDARAQAAQRQEQLATAQQGAAALRDGGAGYKHLKEAEQQA